jgi:hypothetical protein
MKVTKHMNHRIKKVIIGTTANRLAEQIVSSTSKGRGSSVPLELQSIDERFNGATMLFFLFV